MRSLITSLLLATTILGCSDANIDSSIDAQDINRSPEVASLIKSALAGTHAYDITESLTTEIGPRVGGSPEEALAREWAVAKFKEIGLQNVRVEPFTMPYWERGIETASIVTPFPQQLYICLLYTSPSPRDATLSRMPSSA